jgi:hypothetical protein
MAERGTSKDRPGVLLVVDQDLVRAFAATLPTNRSA